MIKKKSQITSIGDKINELLAPKALLDPEYNSDDETIAKTRRYESEDEQDQPVELSHIRKKNVRMLQDIDAKYSGKISSRNELDRDSTDYEESSDSAADTEGFSLELKELGSDDDDDNVGTDDEVSKDSDKEDVAIEDDTEDEDSHIRDEEASSFDEDESDFGGGDILAEREDDEMTDPEPEKDDEKQLQINKDVQKGVSIQNQLQIWEKLLEIRIHSQKMLLKANSLPQPNHFQQLASKSSFDEEASKTVKNVENLLTKMCNLQKALVNQFPETKQIAAKRPRTDLSDETDKICKFAKKLDGDFADFKDYRNTTISKWYDRTKVLTPGSKNLKLPAFDIIRNIEGVLSNKDELIKKTQLYKGGYEIIGMKNTTSTARLNDADRSNPESKPVHCSEIYDDTDFYHTQLRELIEFKTNTSTNPADMTKQFVELQKLRNKIKKVVDTRASKGRKIRYAVHNKMVNFMARNDPTEWSTEAKTELFSSLFGSRTG